MPALNQLKVSFWNAQGINSLHKRLQLELFLERENIDILLLVETFLKQQNNMELRNFVIHRNDRETHAHGGVAIAVRKSIIHKVLSPHNTNFIENLAIEVTINNIRTIITSAYSPHSSNHFGNDEKLLTSLSGEYLIFGDFNAKHRAWNCKYANKSGNALFSLLQTEEFLIYQTTLIFLTLEILRLQSTFYLPTPRSGSTWIHFRTISLPTMHQSLVQFTAKQRNQ